MHTYFKFSIFYYLKQFLRSKIGFILAYCTRFRHTKQKDFRILRYIQGCIFIVVTLEISIAIISTFSLMATHHFLWIHQLRLSKAKKYQKEKGTVPILLLEYFVPLEALSNSTRQAF